MPESYPYRCIPLTQGQYAFVDEADFEYLNQFPWFARWNPEAKTFYASRTIILKNGVQQTIHMHNVVTLPKRGKVIDHWNGCGLDNRRINLRPVTARVNAINRKMMSTNTSGCTGVKYAPGRYVRSPWVATVQVNGKRVYLGYFERKEDAIAARIAGEARYYGDAIRSGAPDVPTVILNPLPRAKSVRNTSGFEGVDFRKGRAKPWRSRVRIDNVVHHIGHFDSPEKAARARKKFLRNHPHRQR